MHHSKKSYIDYQARASEFKVGDSVFLWNLDSDHLGRVVQVFPAIGMVDVAYPNGVKRHPVEELQRFIVSDSGASYPDAPYPSNVSIPGGYSFTNVSPGPYDSVSKRKDDAKFTKDVYKRDLDREGANYSKSVITPEVKKNLLSKVASHYVNALYWGDKDRKYRAKSEELEGNRYGCPDCKTIMIYKNYRRRAGVPNKLFLCPKCNFSILAEDIIGHPSYVLIDQ
jgi:hypothetical protein